MKRWLVFLIGAGGVLGALLSGCYLDPKRGYPGPDHPKKDLALLTQSEDLLYRPVYVLVGTNGQEEVQIDDLGVVVLPGTYSFKAKLYRPRLREVQRIATLTVVPGESDFPVQQPVLYWDRADQPYRETPMVRFTVAAGFRYGLWCGDDEQVRMKPLGPYE